MCTDSGYCSPLRHKKIRRKTAADNKALSLDMVEISGIEPLTSWMPFKRSPSWAIPPNWGKEHLPTVLFYVVYLACRINNNKFLSICQYLSSKNFAVNFHRQLESRPAGASGLLCRFWPAEKSIGDKPRAAGWTPGVRRLQKMNEFGSHTEKDTVGCRASDRKSIGWILFPLVWGFWKVAEQAVRQ